MRKYTLLMLSGLILIFSLTVVRHLGNIETRDLITMVIYSPGSLIMAVLYLSSLVGALVIVGISIVGVLKANRIAYRLFCIALVFPMLFSTAKLLGREANESAKTSAWSSRIGGLQRQFFPIADMLVDYCAKNPDAIGRVHGTEEVTVPAFVEFCSQGPSFRSLNIKTDGRNLLDDLGKPVRYFIHEGRDGYLETEHGKVAVAFRQATNAVIITSDNQVAGVSGYNISR
jgi:hypothetical protein